MNANPTFGRRQFLQAGAATGGVLALGFDTFGNIVKAAEGEAPKPAASPFGPKLFDTWLRFNPDNTITLVSGEVEFGQGVNTGLATLVAEELDADFAQMRVIQGDGNPVYANPGTHTISTNSSASVRNRYDQMRKIGATGRAMLVQAAANQWKVPVADITVSKGVISHAVSKRTATFAQLAPAAATSPIPTEVAMKDPSQWKLIGSPGIQRMDIAEKCTGKANYGVDVRVPNMVHAAVMKSPVLGGTVKSFDATAAKAKKGVKDVISLGFGVAVIADDEWTARNALQSVKVVWDEGKWASLSSEQLATEYHDALDGKGPAGRLAKNIGDVDAATKAPGAKVVEAEYTLPYLHHTLMEPPNSCVWVHDGICEVWTPNANTSNVLRAMSYLTGLPQDKVHVFRTPYAGGSFGRRGRTETEVEAAVISQKIGLPVHVLHSREEDITHSFNRPYTKTRLRASIDKDGNLTGWYQKIACQEINETNLTEVTWPGTVDMATIRADGAKLSALYNLGYDFFAANASPVTPPYNTVPNIHVETVPMVNVVGVSHWRSVAKSGGIYIMEAFVDELAEAAKMDPIAFRRQVFAKNPRALAILDRIAKEVNWQPIVWGKKPDGNGWGIGYADMGYGAMCAIAIQVSVDAKKKMQIKRIVSVIDQGVTVNPDITHAQVQGGIIDGLSSTMYGQITLKGGKVQQSNFGDYRLLTLREAPPIESIIIDSKERPGSMSEMSTPAMIAPLANAIYQATGQRIRELPLMKSGYSI